MFWRPRETQGGKIRWVPAYEIGMGGLGNMIYWLGLRFSIKLRTSLIIMMLLGRAKLEAQAKQMVGSAVHVVGCLEVRGAV